MLVKKLPIIEKNDLILIHTSSSSGFIVSCINLSSPCNLVFSKLLVQLSSGVGETGSSMNGRLLDIKSKDLCPTMMFCAHYHYYLAGVRATDNDKNEFEEEHVSWFSDVGLKCIYNTTPEQSSSFTYLVPIFPTTLNYRCSRFYRNPLLRDKN